MSCISILQCWLIVFFSSLVRPVIEILGPNKPLEEGDSANLTCNIIKGLPEPQLSMVKTEDSQGQPAAAISKYGYLLFEKLKLTLLLTNITERVEGRYTCIAQNDGGYYTASKHITVKSKLILII